MSINHYLTNIDLNARIREKCDITVATLAERDAIATWRRKWLMLVGVYNDSDPTKNGFYVLKYNLSSTTLGDNDNWETFDYLKLDQTTRQRIINGAPIFGAGLDMDDSDIEKIRVAQFSNDLEESVDVQESQLHWNEVTGTLELGLLGGNCILQIGQQIMMRAINTDSITITKGQVVYVTGADSGLPEIALATATMKLPNVVFGIAFEDIETTGFVLIRGVLENIDTDGLAEGSKLYLSTTAGAFSDTAPAATNQQVLIGYVLNEDNSSGSIYVGIINFAIGTHNDLSGLQGGGSDEYYHLTVAEVNALHARKHSITSTDDHENLSKGCLVGTDKAGPAKEVDVISPLELTAVGLELSSLVQKTAFVQWQAHEVTDDTETAMLVNGRGGTTILDADIFDGRLIRFYLRGSITNGSGSDINLYLHLYFGDAGDSAGNDLVTSMTILVDNGAVNALIEIEGFLLITAKSTADASYFGKVSYVKGSSGGLIALDFPTGNFTFDAGENCKLELTADWERDDTGLELQIDMALIELK